MIQKKDDEASSGESEREALRVRLSRQIGRLLAHEWLRNRNTIATESSASRLVPDADPDVPARTNG